MVFADPSVVGIRQALGDGGFGTVYLGTLSVKVRLRICKQHVCTCT